MAKRKVKKTGYLLLLILIIIIICCVYAVLSNKKDTLHCTMKIDEDNLTYEESLDYEISKGSINKMVISEYYDLGKMIKTGSSEEGLNKYGKSLKDDEKSVCKNYKDCSSEVDFKESDYINVKISLGKDDIKIKDIKKLKASEIKSKIKKESIKKGYSCK